MDPVLAIDVGGGTSDILLWEDGKEVENCAKMVLPSRTRVVAEEIRSLTSQGKDIFLGGRLMGGGPSSSAVRAHLAAGLRVFATEPAALTIHDNLSVVKEMGVEIAHSPPSGATRVLLGDVDVEALREIFSRAGLAWPGSFAVAVQDHGYSPNGSNRLFRFNFWHEFVSRGGLLKELAFLEPPPIFTRMLAVQQALPGALVMDTGSAAVLGALQDTRARGMLSRGLTVVNVGNFHTVAALVKDERVFGIYEHHTGLLSPELLADHLERFRLGALTNDEIFTAHGHGCTVHRDVTGASDFGEVVVTGPRRRLARGLGYHQAVPFGDVMLSGCFGLVAGFLMTRGE